MVVVDFTQDVHVFVDNMVSLPLEFDTLRVRARARLFKGRKRHVLLLPDSIESVVLRVGVDLAPVVAHVPCHSNLLELVAVVDRGIGMVLEANDAQTVIENRHRDRCAFGQHCLDNFMAMRGETEHSVVLKADEVELGSTDSAVDLEVVLGLMLQLHQLQVPNLKAVALFRYD